MRATAQNTHRGLCPIRHLFVFQSEEVEAIIEHVIQHFQRPESRDRKGRQIADLHRLPFSPFVGGCQCYPLLLLFETGQLPLLKASLVPISR